MTGPDGYDPRQYAPRVHPYTKSLEGNVSELRIGMVKEGFGHSSSEKDVDTKVQKAAQLLTKLGATAVWDGRPVASRVVKRGVGLTGSLGKNPAFERASGGRATVGPIQTYPTKDKPVTLHPQRRHNTILG